MVHLAFNHDFSRYAENCKADGRLLDALARALQGTNKALIATSGTTVTAKDTLSTENDTAVGSIRGEAAASASPATMTVIPLRDALNRTFRPLVAALPDGPQIVLLDGDPESGSSVTLFRYQPDYAGSGRLHTHSYDYHSVLIEGAMKHWGEGGHHRPQGYAQQRRRGTFPR